VSIKDRVKELRRVKASELVPHPGNYRRHPEIQKHALAGVLAELGYCSALVARELPDGRLGLLDGHLRADLTPDEEVPVVVVDLTEEEAKKFLVTFDPLTSLAETDQEILDGLLEGLGGGPEFQVSLTELWPDAFKESIPEPPAEPFEGDKIDWSRPLMLTAEQRAIVDQAIAKIRTMENDAGIAEGRCIELALADWLS